jgi:hypothetical protein
MISFCFRTRGFWRCSLGIGHLHWVWGVTTSCQPDTWWKWVRKNNGESEKLACQMPFKPNLQMSCSIYTSYKISIVNWLDLKLSNYLFMPCEPFKARSLRHTAECSIVNDQYRFAKSHIARALAKEPTAEIRPSPLRIRFWSGYL